MARGNTGGAHPCLAATALGVCLLTVGCEPRSAPRNARVDRLFAQWDRSGSPGAAVVVVKDGAIVYQRGYGYANLEHRVAIDSQTIFDVASVAKQFTGLSVAMLVEKGKLSLDADIRQYLPDVPDFGKPISIGHLLHHTSGLRDWPETLGLSGLDMADPISLDTILEMVRRQRELDFPTGQEYLYSNTGYNLLAAAVAQVTGQSFRAWTEANLFQPLGMKRTLVREQPDEVVPNCADCYAPTGEGKFRRVASQLAAQGSSSLLITSEDMGKWLLNLGTARVGGKAVESMRQPGRLNNGEQVNYGFGLELGDYRGSPIFSHGGGWAGYRSFVIHIPSKRFGVAILSNAGNLAPQGLALQIADLYLGHSSAPSAPPKPPPAIKPDRANWNAFLGTYRLGPGWLLTITREEDRLMAQATREDKFRMTQTSDNAFFVEAYGAAVEFISPNSGSNAHLVYRGIKAPKLVLPESTPARLAAYLGDYWSEELRVAGRIEIHEGRLASHQRSGAWLDFLPTGEDRFDAETGTLVLEFARNSASEVTEVKVSGGRVRHLRYVKATLPQR